MLSVLNLLKISEYRDTVVIYGNQKKQIPTQHSNTVNRAALIESLRRYTTPFAEEQAFIKPFLELLQQARAYHRDHLPGHITGSAWIIDTSGQRVLLTHHAKLNRWLQPGGHADGDENILQVARREAEEETGLTHFANLVDGIFDIDIHTIPARTDFPQHLHYDVRFLLQADTEDELMMSDESHDLAWFESNRLKDYVQGNASIMRMHEKVQRLFGADQ
jgi:8-oxo-dGTP pyrophosphatase MutT (NUDIX family)